MAVVYAVSEFTDENGEDWKVKIVDGSISTGDLNHAFVLGPDGFRLNYAFDNFDRSKPILGSKVELTLFHPDANDAVFNALYQALDTAVEGTYRVEIYRDPDGDNETWWVGEILPEQTVIPDEFPHAAVSITAVDGLGNLKGIKYNDDDSAYEGDDTIIAHLYKALTKTQAANFWGSGDVLINFFEDFIAAQYLSDIGSAQNQQLSNAKTSHDAFYNKDDNGLKEYFSAYDVLESIALTFNSCVFMAQGRFWFLPLGTIQSHVNGNLQIAHYVSGNGTVTYNTVANVTIHAAFGNDSLNFEKLAGWERSSSPAFKEVKKIRNYQGNMPIVGDTHYSENDLVVNRILDDEDIDYETGTKFSIRGWLMYGYSGDGVSENSARAGRVKLSIKVKLGDAGGTVRYLKRAVDFSDQSDAASFYDNAQDEDPETAFYFSEQYDPTTWDASESTYDVLSFIFDTKMGTEYGFPTLYPVPFEIVTPALPADSQGLQLSAVLSGVNFAGVNDTALVNTTNADFYIYNYAAFIYDDEAAQSNSTVEIKAINGLNARYHMSQGTTLLGDRITDNDLGTISINDGSDYVDASSWSNSQYGGIDLSINKLGVQERLGANKTAKRTERGTLFRTGTRYIHPYTILTNSDQGVYYYQLTGLTFIASRCEYDVECMYLSRDITEITIVQGDPQRKPDTGNPPDAPVGFTTSGGTGPIIGINLEKTQNISIDAGGIDGLKMSDGLGSFHTYAFPTTLPASPKRLVMLLSSSGQISSQAAGTVGQVLTMADANVPTWADAAAGGGGWFGSTALLKVMPAKFIMNDDYNRAPVMVEDDVSGYLGIKAPSASSELYAFVAIPTGYKATHVQVYASASTSSAVGVASFNHTTGAIVSKGTGDFNSAINITDISSSATINVSIKLAPNSSVTVIYGADVTIAAI